MIDAAEPSPMQASSSSQGRGAILRQPGAPFQSIKLCLSAVNLAITLLSLLSTTHGFQVALLLSPPRNEITNGLIGCTRIHRRLHKIPSTSTLSLANNDDGRMDSIDPDTKSEVRKIANHLATQTIESLLSPSEAKAISDELLFDNDSQSPIFNDASYQQYVKYWTKVESRLREEDKRTPADLLGSELTERILSSIRGDGRSGSYDPQIVITFLESDAINSLLTRLLYDAIFEFTMKIDILGNAISNLPLLGPVRNQVLKETKRNMDRTLGPLLQRFLSGYTRVATRQAVDFVVSEENASAFGKANARLVSYLLEQRRIADWLPDESLLVKGREEIWNYLVGLEYGDEKTDKVKDDQKKFVEQSIEWVYDLVGDKCIEDVGLNCNDVLDASPTLEMSLGKIWKSCQESSKS